ncbi:MAG: DNA adenine methylase [Candidatus Hermodarchaeota archaeon]
MSIPFPQTRYQGSKLKLINWYLPIFHQIRFETVLDGFGGTGAVSHMFKRMGKKVTYNDYLISNWYIGKALIENSSIKLDLAGIPDLFEQKNHITYQTVIQDTFQDIYFTDEENHLLDILVQNIQQLENEYKKALAYFALFQACIQKRPFNLFHRKNLYIRFNDVERSFGNKKTWDTPFLVLFLRALKEANKSVFDNNQKNVAMNYSVFDIKIPEEGYDLVYLDPPYISPKGVGVDYRDFYHFLEGICMYGKWKSMLDYRSKHRRLIHDKSPWTNPNQISEAFEKTVKKFQDSKIVISYRNPGLPTLESLISILLSYKKEVNVEEKDYKYVLTSRRKRVKEILIIA